MEKKQGDGEKETAEYATELNDLAELYNKQGKWNQAEPLYKESLAIRKKVLGNEHADVANSLYNLAELHQKGGKYDEAAIKKKKKRFGFF